MKVAFMGSDPIALPVLRHLAGSGTPDFDLCAIFTQPDRKSGRGMKLRPNEIKSWALERAVPVYQPRKCGSADAALLKEARIDFILVMAYGQMLPASILEAAPLGILNLHASILPRLRGASPIHTAVALGLPETGVSLMRITAKMDAGPVAGVERVEIGSQDTSADIHGKLALACIPLMERCLPAIKAGTLSFTPQDPDQVSYCRIIEKSDAQLDFRESASTLANRVRAFKPWPGTRFPYEGTDISILEAEAVEESEVTEPGTLHVDPSGSVRIMCGKGALQISKLQRPGGKPLPVGDFLRGFPMQPGTVLQSIQMRPLESATPFPHRPRGNSSTAGT
jgi:methionyl-tRNA formyltransferase